MFLSKPDVLFLISKRILHTRCGPHSWYLAHRDSLSCFSCCSKKNWITVELHLFFSYFYGLSSASAYVVRLTWNFQRMCSQLSRKEYICTNCNHWRIPAPVSFSQVALFQKLFQKMTYFWPFLRTFLSFNFCK